MDITRGAFIKAQFIGVAAVAAYCIVGGLIIFQGLKHTIGLRASEEEEIAGMDISEHGISGYADFSLKSDH